MEGRAYVPNWLMEGQEGEEGGGRQAGACGWEGEGRKGNERASGNNGDVEPWGTSLA
jgi:hypothetical protein